jgi:hypothetical protein
LGGEEYSSYSFTTSALDGGEWSESRPGRDLPPEERTPGTHWTGGWVGPRAGLDTEVRGKILFPCRGSNPDRPDVQPVVRHYTDWATPAPRCIWEERNMRDVRSRARMKEVEGKRTSREWRRRTVDMQWKWNSKKWKWRRAKHQDEGGVGVAIKRLALLCSEGSGFRTSSQRQAVLTKYFHCFTQFLQPRTEIIPYIRQRPLPSNSLFNKLLVIIRPW